MRRLHGFAEHALALATDHRNADHDAA